MIEVGDKAPNFTLFASDKKEHNLSAYRGKNVVLFFFPMAFSSVCTRQLCGLRDETSMLNGLDAEVLAISVDSLYTLAKFKETEALNFTLLSDWNKETSRAYDTLYEEFSYGMRGVSKRSVFVLDKNGIVKHAEVLENAGDIPNFKSIIETLSTLS